MKRQNIVRIYSAILLMVFTIGSFLNSPVKADTKNVPTQKLIKAVEKQSKVAFLNDAFIVEIPINHIGFYSFIYPVPATWLNVVTPVAHGPPNRIS